MTCISPHVSIEGISRPCLGTSHSDRTDLDSRDVSGIHHRAKLKMGTWFASLTLKEICSICGKTAGKHKGLDASCPIGLDLGVFSKTNRFKAVLAKQIPSLPDLPNLPWKGMKDPSQELCPCGVGITRSQCEYHKE